MSIVNRIGMDTSGQLFWMILITFIVLVFLLITILSVIKIHRYRENNIEEMIHSVDKLINIYESMGNGPTKTMRTKISKNIFKLIQEHPLFLQFLDDGQRTQEPSQIEEKILPKTQIISVPHRFNILFTLSLTKSINFSTLKKNLKMSSGNLKHHISKLEELRWVEETYDYDDRVRTMINITPLGEEEFSNFISDLKIILKNFESHSEFLNPDMS